MNKKTNDELVKLTLRRLEKGAIDVAESTRPSSSTAEGSTSQAGTTSPSRGTWNASFGTSTRDADI